MTAAPPRLAGVDLALEVQLAADSAQAPRRRVIERAARAALAGRRARAELTIRIVDQAESRALNRRYRGRDEPTNVLSFPAQGVAEVAPDFVGDIAICALLVEREARAQGKAPEAHWSHLVVHGVLHLLGYDHGEEAEAQAMEERERTILRELGFADPYLA